MRWVFATLMLCIAPVPALAQSAADLREFGSNFGLTPVQARRVFALYDGAAERVGALAAA